MRNIKELTEAEQQAISQAVQGGARLRDLDRQYDLSVGAISDWMYRRRRRGVQDDLPVDLQASEEVDQISDPDQWAHDVALERAQGRVSQLQRLYNQALKEKAAVDRLVETMDNAVRAADPVEVRPIPQPAAGKGEHRMVALLSDVHVGEVVSSAETNNLGAYDLELFYQRLDTWTAKVLELVELRRQRLHVPELSLFMLGDMVSGDIHDELVRTNDVMIVDQVVLAAQRIASAVLHAESALRANRRDGSSGKSRSNG